MKTEIARARTLVPAYTLILGLSLTLAVQAFCVTLEQLQNDPKLTPKRFAGYFSDFEFEFHREVQAPEVFLRTKAGDCDDYATLADRVLSAKGYHTRLIHVTMPGGPAHVVCYVAEEKGYLDYNSRSYFFKIEHAGSTIPQIAAKVAKSFRSEWSAAREFTCAGDQQHVVETVFKLMPKKGALVVSGASSASSKVTMVSARK